MLSLNHMELLEQGSELVMVQSRSIKRSVWDQTRNCLPTRKVRTLKILHHLKRWRSQRVMLVTCKDRQIVPVRIFLKPTNKDWQSKEQQRKSRLRERLHVLHTTSKGLTQLKSIKHMLVESQEQSLINQLRKLELAQFSQDLFCPSKMLPRLSRERVVLPTKEPLISELMWIRSILKCNHSNLSFQLQSMEVRIFQMDFWEEQLEELRGDKHQLVTCLTTDLTATSKETVR